MTNDIIKVLTSEANMMACELLATALERACGRIRIVGRGVSVDEVLTAADAGPDVALISSNLQDGALSGFRALRELHTFHSTIQPIMMLDTQDRELIIAAFRGGARGVYFRMQPFETLLTCIQSVHQGQVWASNTELQYILEALTTAAPLRGLSADSAPLTKREEQVAMLVAQGLTNREISRKLNLSEHTIKNYLFRTFEKLGVSNRVELALHLNSNARKTAA